MRRFASQSIGVEQGDALVFSEFEDGGAMWTGQGSRERRRTITFSEPYKSRPVVQVAMSMLDADTSVNLRCECIAEHITRDGFDLVFKTWSDSRVARVRLTWIAFGELGFADDWDV
ncbi:H-type lectin domain-containing protein [Mesobacterium sp. TK19101]|uniref:H-type lectin domain-containing protein n=1 Tax=Mesobacterium hydrothermale TaxID=3111907 RepID=A0ABU6HJW7_9RHOB|nr:H-type lectin domain-containing protein [Mesobacterium sp. TK19101]MEC3862742.1 H-type lectin domain-containing protein [Mesobacterium sp. TK19101]